MQSWKSSGRDRGGVKLHCLLSAVNTANCAAAKRAGEPPLDPARAVKIHGRTGKWCNSNTVELKSTQWREVQSMYVSGVMILPEVTYAEEQKRKPHESHKGLTAGPWMSLRKRGAPSGYCGSLRKPRGSGKQQKQGADCNSPSSTFHRRPAAV